MRANINDLFEIYKQNVCFNAGLSPVNFLFMSKEEKKEKFLNEEANRVEQEFFALGMTQAQFSRKLGIRSQDWTNWRSLKRKGIPKERLVAISKIIQKSVDWILTGNEFYPDIGDIEILNRKNMFVAIEQTEYFFQKIRIELPPEKHAYEALIAYDIIQGKDPKNAEEMAEAHKMVENILKSITRF